MYKFSCVLGFCLFFSLHSFAQKIELNGQIIDSSTKEAIPYVHIVNMSTQQGTVSNTEGRFWITMDKRDTLQFSSIGFEKSAFTLKQDMSTDKLVITIELNSATMELQPVNVFAYRNEAALKKALLNMTVPIEKEKGLKIPGVKEAQKYIPNETPGFVLSSPLTSIAKIFSKEEKEKKLLKKYKKEYAYQKLITSKYNQTVVMEITNLPEDKVEDFMKFCVLEDSFIYRATEYELATVLHQCRIDFEKLKDQ